MDYEKLGAFYLGKRFDLAAGERTDDIILYDSRDLTTHAVIIGMTGSGKTGLGIGLLEEALIDNIPVIAIDPKGDLPNLLLTFPELRPSDFRPWINEQEGINQGLSPDEFAAAQAELWKNGLARWGQDGERIRRLRENVSFSVYTPGSSAGRPINILRSFAPPPKEVRDDSDLWRDTIRSTTTSLLTLIGVDADPLTSREHILIANILEDVWSDDRAIDLPGLIRAIQNPPFDRLGVLDLQSFFPQNDRFALSMRLNNLLASPGFAAWLEGEPLDISSLLYGEGGRPRASIFSIAHLPDAERMFFVSMLLNRIVGWMRTQPGTNSLRAILYIDEVFGYLPPVANPASKQPLLTLLKQARAFGLGVVVATQNPVDLDYKGLSNAGTWFLGRLQTERDKARVLDGLDSAAGGGIPRSEIDTLLSSVGKRVFLLHSVHETAPVLFETRWVMSYLRGPMTREQIRQLQPAAPPSTAASSPHEPLPPTAATTPPVIPPGIDVWYVAPSGTGRGVQYAPALLARCSVHYTSTRHGVDATERLALVAPFAEGPEVIDWSSAETAGFQASDLRSAPESDAVFEPLPPDAARAANYTKWKKDLERTIRQQHPLIIHQHKATKLSSDPGESEAEFRARVAQKMRELRDMETTKLRRKYEARFRTLESRLQRADQAVDRQKAQAKHKKLDTAVSFGTAILGAVLGRKQVSVTNASRVGTAVRKAGGIGKTAREVEHARERRETVQSELQKLQDDLENEVAALEGTLDPALIELDEVSIRATSTNIDVQLFGLAWLPYRTSVETMAPDW
jgi:hypothetical protein